MENNEIRPELKAENHSSQNSEHLFPNLKSEPIQESIDKCEEDLAHISKSCFSCKTTTAQLSNCLECQRENCLDCLKQTSNGKCKFCEFGSNIRYL
jgi:hypothetical protein